MEYQPNIKQITGEGGVISAVVPGTIADELGWRPGDTIVAVGSLRLRDIIGYRFAISEEQIEVLLRTAQGEQTFSITKDPDRDLGVEFTEPLFDRLRTCNNKCPFCFLTQMPKGMRKTLYLKDDDYRLSFLYNNFVTFTNLDEADWQRIEQQRLSPMNISVHASDPTWRALMLGKRELPDVREQIKRLGAMGIEVHTQIVACPGANDGEVLAQTIADLGALYPIVQSISVVPVGLTKYRFDGKRPSSIKAAIQVHESSDWIDSNWERQPLWNDATPSGQPLHDPQMGFCSRLGASTDIPLRCFNGPEAAAVIDLLEPFAQQFQAEHGLNLVYASDEFYLLAERSTPPAEFYDGMPQYSNGVGMVRDFLDTWAKTRCNLPARLPQPTAVALVCGTLALPLLQTVAERLNRVEGLVVEALPITNEFFGATVTVSGLLTAQDIIPELQKFASAHAGQTVRALLPSVMFDFQGERTIDEYSPQRISEAANLPVALANDPEEIVRYVRALSKAHALPTSEIAATSADPSDRG